MKLKVTHLTQYTYKEPVIDSVNELRLTPITNEYQTCSEHSITVEPTVNLFSYTDYFGNLTHYFTLHSPHQQLSIRMDAIVETHLTEQQKQSKLALEDENKILSSEKFQNEYAEFLMETPYTVLIPELLQFIQTKIDKNQCESTYGLLDQISHVIYTHFTYDPDATNVHTTLEETLQLKRGVCQDYAHLMIGICRILHIPARYVSGYHFMGDPEDNQIHFQHASHAWVEAYIPLIGWVGFDPTNNGKIDWRYIKVSHGRDYNDIAPVKGVYKGSSNQELTVSVDLQYIN
jgi:transglutaminase-like putative cysteine protease